MRFKQALALMIVGMMVLTGLTINTSQVGVSTAQEMEPIKIAAIFDLTGPTSDVGQFYANGIIGYVDWVNANGGIEGHPIELISQDYAYSVETAENLYIDFVGRGAIAFMGWGTGDTEALRGRIAEDEIPFMSASYSAPLGNPEDAPYNFLVGTSYSDQLVIMLEYMLTTWEEEGNAAEDMKVVVFHHDSPFGLSPVADGAAWAAEHGVQYTNVAMPGGASSYDAEITTNVVDAEATHIVIQNVSTPAALLLRNLNDLGLMEFVQVGCLNWCADETLINAAGEASEGVLGALPFGPTSVEVPGQEAAIEWLAESDMTLEEATLHYTQGWWTMAVMVEGIRLTLVNGHELTGANVKANLETITEFDTGGITAPITFTSEDHRGNRSLVIYAVEDGVWVEASDIIDLRGEMMEEHDDMGEDNEDAS
jgi:branched-chain amino acid transport system substrate-binding protein